MVNPLACDRCGHELESDDAISIVEGVCRWCRSGQLRPAGQVVSAAKVVIGEIASGKEDVPLEAVRLPDVRATSGGVRPQGIHFACPNVDSRVEQVGRTASVPSRSPERVSIKLDLGLDQIRISPPKWRLDDARPNMHRPPATPPLADTPPLSAPMSFRAGEAAPSPVRTRPGGKELEGAIEPERGRRSLVEPATQPHHDPETVARHRRRRRDLAIGMSIGLVLTIGVTGHFLNEAGRIAVGIPGAEALPITCWIEPATAKVTLNGELVGPIDVGGKLELQIPIDAEDAHWLEVSATGYRSQREPLSHSSGVREVTVRLDRLPYSAVFRSEPSGGEVWLDGELKGMTPLELTLSPNQKGSAVVRLPGYREATVEFEPPTEDRTVDILSRLEVLPPVVRVETDPPGAEVVVEGRTRGISPLDVELGEDDLGRSISIQAGLKGFQSATLRTTLPDIAEAPVVSRLTLKRLAAEVEITTDPPGGQIVVNGRFWGTSPVIGGFDEQERDKTLHVQAIVPGSRRGSQEIRVPAPGDRISVTVPMTTVPLRLCYLLMAQSTDPTDVAILQEAIMVQIHALEPPQSFTLLAFTDRGIDAWPAESDAATATPEQKTRAYDWIRSFSAWPTDTADELIAAATDLRPDATFIGIAGIADTGLQPMIATLASKEESKVDIAVTSSGANDDSWINWTAERGGVFVVLDAPAAASTPLAGRTMDE